MKYDVMEIPNGESGNWKIEEFEITEDAAKFENMRMSFQAGMGSRFVTAGHYKRLKHFQTTVMSNTRTEKSDYHSFLWRATGAVLINGLGLGVLLADVLNKESVEDVAVIEISQDVINLVYPYFQQDSRLEIVLADAYTWKPPKRIRYNAVWHDVWSSICPDNLPKMHKLHRKYGRKTDWQGSWARSLCELYR